MAQVKFEKIVSCSSEDPDFPAKNLLTCGEVPGSWKTAEEGVSQATVVIKLDRPYRFNQLEIKNECSAFIEILVANQSDAEVPRFQVLLSASSFMTPNESKNLSNINRCRVFTKDKLSPSALKQSFDLVKINCTQPFNKTVKYGVSSMKMVESEAVDPNDSGSSTGLAESPGIKLRPTENRNLAKRSPSPTPTKLIVTPPQTKNDKATTAHVDNQSSPSPSKKPKEVKKDVEKASTSAHEKQPRAVRDDKKPKVDRPFCQLMTGVTFTISGFQNPLRSEIRSKGLQMGAKYKGDWESSCTHLICAFPNTPKYNQVQQTGGTIVTKEWIEDSYNQRRLLPWKKYSLDSQPKKAKKVTKKRKDDESNSEDDHDSEMDDFIVKDGDDDDDGGDSEDEYKPGEDKDDDDDEEDIGELGPVLPSKLRDDSPKRTNCGVTTKDNRPVKKKDEKVNRKAPTTSKNGADDDHDSDAIYDAATDDED